MAARERIIVGISGGVDSAVAALRLLEAGYDVHGLHMTNWEEQGDWCSSAQDFQAARRVCDELDITLHRANFSAEYRERVFADFLAEYRAGRTPNPDVLCNRHIKFGAFLHHARRLGAVRVATGHYARLMPGGPVRLRRAADADKDQTYFLHAVDTDALASSLFPLGDMTKAEVRRLANDAGLSNHGRPDSTGICFIGERPFREFLGRYLHGAEGPILTPEGRELGRHAGLMFYTPGQRSGIGVGGLAGAAGEPWYVACKDLARNALIVVQGRGHPLLWSRELHTGPPRWLGAALPFDAPGPWRCEARIRHRHPPAACRVATRDGGLVIAFDDAQWAPAPGQYAVFYRADECLGGAVIERALTGDGNVPGGTLPA